MSKSERMQVLEGPQLFEVFTGGGRPRRFTSVEKAAV